MVVKNYPSMTSLLDAATASQHPATLVIRTLPDDAGAGALVQAATQHPIADVLIVELPPGAELPSDHPAHDKEIVDGRATAYLCPGQQCLPPVHEAEKLTAYLDDLMSRRQNAHAPSG